ncbi:unnamed protein product, partial [Brassica rapa]
RFQDGVVNGFNSTRDRGASSLSTSSLGASSGITSVPLSAALLCLILWFWFASRSVPWFSWSVQVRLAFPCRGVCGSGGVSGYLG